MTYGKRTLSAGISALRLFNMLQHSGAVEPYARPQSEEKMHLTHPLQHMPRMPKMKTHCKRFEGARTSLSHYWRATWERPRNHLKLLRSHVTHKVRSAHSLHSTSFMVNRVIRFARKQIRGLP